MLSLHQHSPSCMRGTHEARHTRMGEAKEACRLFEPQMAGGCVPDILCEDPIEDDATARRAKGVPEAGAVTGQAAAAEEKAAAEPTPEAKAEAEAPPEAKAEAEAPAEPKAKPAKTAKKKGKSKAAKKEEKKSDDDVFDFDEDDDDLF